MIELAFAVDDTMEREVPALGNLGNLLRKPPALLHSKKEVTPPWHGAPFVRPAKSMWKHAHRVARNLMETDSMMMEALIQELPAESTKNYQQSQASMDTTSRGADIASYIGWYCHCQSHLYYESQW